MDTCLSYIHLGGCHAAWDVGDAIQPVRQREWFNSQDQHFKVEKLGEEGRRERERERERLLKFALFSS